MAKRVTQNLESDFPGEDEVQADLLPEEAKGSEPTDSGEGISAAPIPVQTVGIEEKIGLARFHSTVAADLMSEAEAAQKRAAEALENARHSYDELFEALKGLRDDNRLGYAGSKLMRLLRYIDSAEQ